MVVSVHAVGSLLLALLAVAALRRAGQTRVSGAVQFDGAAGVRVGLTGHRGGGGGRSRGRRLLLLDFLDDAGAPLGFAALFLTG